MVKKQANGAQRWYQLAKEMRTIIWKYKTGFLPITIYTYRLSRWIKDLNVEDKTIRIIGTMNFMTEG